MVLCVARKEVLKLSAFETPDVGKTQADIKDINVSAWHNLNLPFSWQSIIGTIKLTV
jgi:hypothetical protein